MTNLNWIAEEPVCQWRKSKSGTVEEYDPDKHNAKGKKDKPTAQHRWTTRSKLFEEKPERFRHAATVEKGVGKYVKKGEEE